MRSNRRLLSLLLSLAQLSAQDNELRASSTERVPERLRKRDVNARDVGIEVRLVLVRLALVFGEEVVLVDLDEARATLNGLLASLEIGV